MSVSMSCYLLLNNCALNWRSKVRWLSGVGGAYDWGPELQGLFQGAVGPCQLHAQMPRAEHLAVIIQAALILESSFFLHVFFTVPIWSNTVKWYQFRHTHPEHGNLYIHTQHTRTCVHIHRTWECVYTHPEHESLCAHPEHGNVCKHTQNVRTCVCTPRMWGYRCARPEHGNVCIHTQNMRTYVTYVCIPRIWGYVCIHSEHGNMCIYTQNLRTCVQTQNLRTCVCTPRTWGACLFTPCHG